MLIISKFHDYYDQCLSYGVDKSIVFKREQTESMIRTSVLGLKPYRLHDNRVNSCRINASYVYFCGHFYPLITLHHIGDEPMYAYSLEQYVNCIAEMNKILKAEQRDEIKLIEQKTVRDGCGDCRNIFAVKQFFGSGEDARASLIHKLAVPVGMLYITSINLFRESDLEHKFEANISLKDIKFYRVFDVHTTFTKIEQFISGVLGTGSPQTIDIDDKHKLQGRGFDNMSFKKRSE